jgi:hypothetical protein
LLAYTVLVAERGHNRRTAERGSGWMAQRRERRARRPSDRDPARAKEDAHEAQETIEALIRERDGLRSELLAANAQIAALVARQRNVLNRIDWVVDSLNSLAEGEP